MPLLLMEADGVTMQLLAEVAAYRVPHLHILCKAVAVSTWIVAIATVQKLCTDASPSLLLYSVWRYSKSKTFGSNLEWVDIVVVDNWPFWTCRRHETRSSCDIL